MCSYKCSYNKGEIIEIEFEWDENKRKTNAKKHGVDFADAHHMFEQTPLMIRPDTREDYGEDRWIGLGQIQSRTMVIVFTTPRLNVVRVISLRKADEDEEAYFHQSAFSD